MSNNKTDFLKRSSVELKYALENLQEEIITLSVGSDFREQLLIFIKIGLNWKHVDELESIQNVFTAMLDAAYEETHMEKHHEQVAANIENWLEHIIMVIEGIVKADAEMGK